MSFVEYSYADMHNSAEEVQRELARGNRFSAGDLEQNRRGRISTKQLFKLIGAIFAPILGPTLAIVAWFVFLGLVYVLSPFLPSGRLLWILLKNYMWPLITITVGGALVLVVALMQMGDLFFQVLADLMMGRSATLQGRVSASKGVDDGEGVQRLFGQKVETYAYVLAGHHYRVNKDAYDALLPHSGGVFKLHVACHSKVLLSLEPL